MSGKKNMPKLSIKGAKTIMETEYPTTQFIIENLIPSCGLVLFAGAPKAGKSWFMLQMLSSICCGQEKFIGHQIMARHKCLYLSLEDSESRIQGRMKIQEFAPADDNLLFAFRCPTNEKGLTELRNFLSTEKEIKIVCIDTKGKFCEGRTEEGFQADYTWMSSIKKIADDFNIAIILVTHLRKKQPDEDPYESISGSIANMAASDTTIMLKHPRNQSKASLFITSRDFPETQEEIFFDSQTCTWNVPNGQILTVQENMTPERKKILDAMSEMGGEASPKQIAGIVGGTSKNISNMLSTMLNYGLVEKGNSHGTWKLPTQNKDTCYDEPELL